ncbi:hypothetical protein SPRG_00895 [Saprolegnia parasitica CBS 223.65]|uniref:ODAD1 central coiled coil region domain-containing protein n=1 Tax=Saprolegnia parasitica (strain CBS 223.65) TaxID=695850 RepID=A0A067CVV9_SAPPC|nr:hypothetical protein SPRG_00895 [Saprolegnia parasitica CBS 223.65]KDO34834.1 hypothetical protein SPRG_00895 [Saprolegnia parasitica CBS 223.65]|eukprot:XP_012194497.1 hypothetical protein SPRG_00895 [Saprolegnia parasitica CBS 223.65]
MAERARLGDVGGSSTLGGRDSTYLQDQVRTLQIQGDYYARKVEIEKRRGVELDKQLKTYRETHNETRRMMSASTPPAAKAPLDTASDQKSLRILENRLEKVLIRLNEACNANKKLREQIQNLRREKVQQQQIHEKLDRELHTKAQDVTKTSQLTQSIFDARDRAQRQVEALRAQAAEESARFEADWNERREVIEVDRMTMRSIQNHGSMFAQYDDENDGSRDNGTPDAKLRDDTMKASWLIAAKDADLRKQTERLKAYEDGLAKVRKKTGIKDIGELASALLAAEEKNFSLFNMINELNTEMESVEIENNRFQDMINEVQGCGSDLNRARIKASLEAQIEKSHVKAMHFEARAAESNAVIESIKAGAMNIFHKIGYNDEALLQQLNSTGLTDINMLKFLGIIEKRIGEIVQMHNIVYTQSSSGSKLDVTLGLSPGKGPVKRGNGNLGAHEYHPTPPAADDFVDDDSDDSDELIKPCTLAEIQEKAAAAIGKRKDKPRQKR